jgi:hypothetical protein
MRQRSDLLCKSFLHAPVCRSTAISIHCFELASKLSNRAWHARKTGTLSAAPLVIITTQ